MRMPFDGEHRMTQRFGSNEAAYARFGMRGHNGLDFGLPRRTPLYAVRKGTWWRGNDPTGYGVYGVLTDEDGGEWLYGHLEAHVAPHRGRVDEGALLARSDNTGNSTGNHLHFAYRPAGHDPNNGYLGYVNPRPFLPPALPYRVALQAGHAPDGGGAPGEAAWTPKLAEALAARLTAAGIEVVVSPGFYGREPPAHLGGDFDLYLSLHYDARWPDEYTTGCCVARGLYETEPWEADRFIAHWKDAYAALGVPLKQSRVGPNMTQYYAWRHLSYVTPGVLIEHGVGAPGVGGDADLLWNHLDRVADADANAVVEYLGLEGTVADPGIVQELERQVEELRQTIAARDSELGALKAHVIEPLKQENADLRVRLAAAGAGSTRRALRIVYDDGSAQEVA